MRIIAGQFRGRRLAALGKGDPAAHLRPTTDRVRESLFGMLQGGRFGAPLDGARVLDLFAGTGALGLEALSRGAVSATFVETGNKALALLARNIALCGAEAVATILKRDVRRLGDVSGPPYDLVFLDPPYGQGLGEAALSAALAGGWLADAALVVWEEAKPPSVPPQFHALDVRRFGDTAITILRSVG